MKALFDSLLGIIGILLLGAIIGGGQMAYEFIRDKLKSPEQHAQEIIDRKNTALERERSRKESIEKYGFYMDCSLKFHGKNMLAKYECEQKYQDH